MLLVLCGSAGGSAQCHCCPHSGSQAGGTEGKLGEAPTISKSCLEVTRCPFLCCKGVHHLAIPRISCHPKKAQILVTRSHVTVVQPPDL